MKLACSGGQTLCFGRRIRNNRLFLGVPRDERRVKKDKILSGRTLLSGHEA